VGTPKACLIKDNTITILTKEVVMIRMDGARDRTVRRIKSLMEVSSCPVPTFSSMFGSICSWA
jgi:hypothetical protein